ncbi:MAG: TonB-dependent receptor [Halioglobus sp.]
MKRSVCVVAGLLAVSASYLFMTPISHSGEVVELEEVIVTANRREQSLQNVAISVSAFTDEFFKNSGTSTLKQLEQYTPSLKITAVQDSRSTSIRIRGIGSIGSNAGIDPSVGLFIDGIYQGRAGMSIADFMDTERVEVLRGPQGTLYGKNTAAGAINIISKSPGDYTEAELEAVVGNYNALELRGMVNLPLGDSGHAVRLAGYSVQRDGYDDNEVLGNDMNNADRWGAKGRARFDLAKYGELMFTLDYAEENSDCCAPDIIDYDGDGSALGVPFSLLESSTGETLPKVDPFDHKLHFNQPWKNEVSVGGLAAEWNMELGNESVLTFLNAWRHYENDSRFDGDFSPYEAVSGAAEVELDQYSSELRLTSPEGETWDYVAGLFLYYSDMETAGETGMLELVGSLFGGGFLLPDGSINYDENIHKTTSAATFGQFNWHFSEKWRLTLGARLTYEKKERDGLQRSEPTGVFDAPPISGPDVESSDSRSESDVSPSLSVSYFMRDDLMLYASVSQGFKSGGFNQLRTAIGVPAEFDEESSTSYEVGWKGSWLERRLQLNGTVFFVDYDDFQAQGFDGANITVRNAGSLESKGVELEAIYLPNAYLTTGVAIGYNDATYSDFDSGECTMAQLFAVTGGNPFIPPSCVQDLTGKPLDNAPKWTASTYLQFEDTLTDNLGWFGRVEYNYTDEFYLAQDLDETLLNDDTHLVNARLGIFGEDRRWELTAWGRNLLDEDSYVMGFDIPVLSGFAGMNLPPRTYGLTVNYRTE